MAQVAGAAKGVAQAGMPDEMQQELRDRIAAILEADSSAVGEPIPARLVKKMMSVCSGDPVGDEFVPFILEQAGFTGTQGVDNAARQQPPEGFRILIVGSGGREHALGWKLAQSPLVTALISAPGNPGLAALGRTASIKADDVAEIAALAVREQIDLVVIGPEAPLAAGLADRLAQLGVPAFGPSAAAAELEASKAFM